MWSYPLDQGIRICRCFPPGARDDPMIRLWVPSMTYTIQGFYGRITPTFLYVEKNSKILFVSASHTREENGRNSTTSSVTFNRHATTRQDFARHQPWCRRYVLSKVYIIVFKCFSKTQEKDRASYCKLLWSHRTVWTVGILNWSHE